MNQTIFQCFHWYFPACGDLWNHVKEQAPLLKQLGLTHVWLPPAYKSAKGVDDPGYGVYDLYDLGEFDQKGSVRTKFGTRDEYLGCIEILHQQGIKVLADIVINHRFGADENETASLVKVSCEDRNHKLSPEFRREVGTRFTFPGRNGKYSGFVWNQDCFSGLCIDNEIHLLLHEYTRGHWEETLSATKGNFSYLVGNDVEFRNPAVCDELKRWGEWYVDTAKPDGFRFDALKHMNCEYPVAWLDHLEQHFQRKFFVIGEYWEADVNELLEYSGKCRDRIPLFDVPLHFNFHKASGSGDYDLRNVFDRTLVQKKPGVAITFVDNHDTQPLQELESPVKDWFRPLAYASILLRDGGIPCVFYPALFGAKYKERNDQGSEVEVELRPVDLVKQMLQVRQHHAYGFQQDYFDDPHCVGWTRHGDLAAGTMGCAVLISNRGDAEKRMSMGKHNAGRVMAEISGRLPDFVQLDGAGVGTFRVSAGSVSVWIEKDRIMPVTG